MPGGHDFGPSRVPEPPRVASVAALTSSQRQPVHSPPSSSRMCRRFAHAGAAALAIILLVFMVEARPRGAVLSRPKRVSDQRLAEIETWLALSKMKGKLVTVPIGFGQVDPNKLGRRRRSSTESNLQELQRILRSVVEEDAELSPEDRIRYARLFSSRWDEKDQDQASGDRDDDSLY